MMTVKDLKSLLSEFPDDMIVCVKDKGMTKDAGAPSIVYGANGKVVMLEAGTYDNRGYVINYSKHYGFELRLNDEYQDAMDNLSDSALSALQKEVHDKCGIELWEDGTAEIGKELFSDEDPIETIGAASPRNFAKERYELCDNILAIVKKHLNKNKE